MGTYSTPMSMASQDHASYLVFARELQNMGSNTIKSYQHFINFRFYVDVLSSMMEYDENARIDLGDAWLDVVRPKHVNSMNGACHFGVLKSKKDESVLVFEGYRGNGNYNRGITGFHLLAGKEKRKASKLLSASADFAKKVTLGQKDVVKTAIEQDPDEYYKQHIAPITSGHAQFN